MDTKIRQFLGSIPRRIATGAFTLGLVLAPSLAPTVAEASPPGGCAYDRPCFTNTYDAMGHQLVIEWSTTEEYGHFNFNWARPGGPAHPQELDGNRRRFIIHKVWENQEYGFSIQGCKEVLIGKDDCSPVEYGSHTTGDFPRSGNRYE